MTSDDYIRGRLASLAWSYGHELGLWPMVSILFCVKNRVTDGRWLPVIENINRQMPVNHQEPDPRDPEFLNFLNAVEHVYAGNDIADKWSNGGTHFIKQGQLFWWSEEVHERVAVVNNSLEIWK